MDNKKIKKKCFAKRFFECTSNRTNLVNKVITDKKIELCNCWTLDPWGGGSGGYAVACFP